MTRPHIEALDTQVDLIRGLAPGRIGHLYAAAYEKSLREKSQMLHSGAYQGAQAVDGKLFASPKEFTPMPEWLAHNLDRSETYWIAPEMLDLVDHASPSMPDEPLQLTDLPTPFGFALFGRNSYTRDRQGRKIGFRAIAWWPGRLPVLDRDTNEITWHRGVEVCYFTDRYDYFDDINQSLGDPELMPPLILVHLGFWPEGYRIEDVINPSWWDEIDKKVREAAEDRDGEIRSMMSWIKTFWRLIQQRVATTTHARPDRGALRRIHRSGALTGINDVRVITLRRYREGVEAPDTGPTDEDGVFWSHRWIVDGHWRNQYYPSEDTHRQIWIAPYVKGPEDRPLIVKDKVYRWAR